MFYIYLPGIDKIGVSGKAEIIIEKISRHIY
jgi:hypothetical protein